MPLQYFTISVCIVILNFKSWDYVKRRYQQAWLAPLIDPIAPSQLWMGKSPRVFTDSCCCIPCIHFIDTKYLLTLALSPGPLMKSSTSNRLGNSYIHVVASALPNSQSQSQWKYIHHRSRIWCYWLSGSVCVVWGYGRTLGTHLGPWRCIIRERLREGLIWRGWIG